MNKMNYKLLALVPLFVLTGCKRQEHKNVIIDKITNDTERMFLLSDIQSGQKRVFVYSCGNRKSQCDYLEAGDTISVFTGGVLVSGRNYQKQLVLRGGEVEIEYDTKRVHARQQEYLNQLKQQNAKTR